MNAPYSYSRFVMSGIGSCKRVYDRVLKRSLDRVFTNEYECQKEIERLHDLDRDASIPKEIQEIAS